VKAFEKSFADFCGVAHGVGVNSGTDALILALRALDVTAGDEVVTVSHTALATVAAIVAVGATPVLVDVDATYYTLDPLALESVITARTKAIVAVHLYGQSADMDAIIAVAKKRAVHVIEDCAQAAGGRYKGRRVGSMGEAACFSFYPTKNLGALGDGGMVVTNDGAIAERVRRLRQYGWDESRSTEEPGLNSRLDEIQAAILAIKLPALDDSNARRAAIARRYNAAFAGLPVTLPAERPDTTHVYHFYVVSCDDRNGLREHLAAHDVLAGVHYPMPAHRQGGYENLIVISRKGLNVTDRLVDRILTLPLYPELADGDVERIIAAVRQFYHQSHAQKKGIS
jgi:dTDP-4-amino-4,6-dideoxygalactose transaminase